jgi:hypothetical protein
LFFLFFASSLVTSTSIRLLPNLTHTLFSRFCRR